MSRRKGNLPLIYLHPGEFRFSKTPEVVTTVLGSCVSVTMHVKRLKIGAIFHAMLPVNKGNLIQSNNSILTDKNDQKEITNDSEKYNLKYVDESIYYMLGMFDRYNVDRKEIEIKVFGGANILTNENDRGNLISVGTQNIETALKTLENENLEISASDLGGSRGRKLFFFTETGDIYIKQLGKRKTATIIES